MGSTYLDLCISTEIRTPTPWVINEGGGVRLDQTRDSKTGSCGIQLGVQHKQKAQQSQVSPVSRDSQCDSRA